MLRFMTVVNQRLLKLSEKFIRVGFSILSSKFYMYWPCFLITAAFIHHYRLKLNVLSRFSSLCEVESEWGPVSNCLLGWDSKANRL